MADLLSEAQMRRIKPYFSLSHGIFLACSKRFLPNWLATRASRKMGRIDHQPMPLAISQATSGTVLRRDSSIAEHVPDD